MDQKKRPSRPFRPFSFLPRGYASLLDYISPAAFDVVNWQGALRRSAEVTRELLWGSSVPLVQEQLRERLPPGLVFAAGPHPQDARSSGDHGSRILELYFVLVSHSAPVFLDLRWERFQERSDGLLEWRPSGLWTTYSPEFREAVSDLYAGFYDDNRAQTEDALSRLGLWPGESGAHPLSRSGRAELFGLLEDHFGQGRTEPMSFEVAHFVKSFDALFLFLARHKIRVSEDFLFLGIQILTLYLHLERLGGRHDVAGCFRRSRERFLQQG